ncbi:MULTISPECIES: hypothetical protein [Kocuria]|uniref:hypothetical protein n=1 Tax=Kocuria TaxID=57493 RepID=UPI000B03609E|nr:hypothetical protein [Kocuria polaris]
MPTAPAPRSAVTRAATAAVLVLALTGCSAAGPSAPSAEREAAEVPGQDGRTPTATSAAAASGDASVATVRQTCDRVLETVRTAPQQLREDPAGLFAEVDELAATAPDELTGQLTSVREAVSGFRQGERSFIDVVQEVRGLQERCSG